MSQNKNEQNVGGLIQLMSFNDLWMKNFYMAKRFFEFNGGIKTKSKYKAEWHDRLKNDALMLCKMFEYMGRRGNEDDVAIIKALKQSRRKGK